MQEYYQSVYDHYVNVWGISPDTYIWDQGPLEKMDVHFRVLEFPPSVKRSMWTYATCGMSSLEQPNPIELHIFSSKKDIQLVELLTATAYYHQNTNKLSLNNTVWFGQSWQGQSDCDYGFISLPYIDGPELENLSMNNKEIKFYWLIPITGSEVSYLNKHGIVNLEEKFDEEGLDYLNPDRNSVV